MSWQIVFSCNIISLWSFLTHLSDLLNLTWWRLIMFLWFTVTSDVGAQSQYTSLMASIIISVQRCSRKPQSSLSIRNQKRGRGALCCQSAGWKWQLAGGANVCLQLEGWRVLLSSAAANTCDCNTCHQMVPMCSFAGAISKGSAAKPTFH